MKTKEFSAKHQKVDAERIFVVTTSSEYQKRCANSLKRLTRKQIVKLVSFPQLDERTKSQPTTLLVSRLADISKANLERAGVDATTRQLVFLEGLPVEAVPARLLPLNIRNPERIHIAAQRDPLLIENLIFRIFSGMTETNQSHPIVDAWIENQQLVLLSPTFSRLEIPLEKLVRFVGTDRVQVGAFEVDDDGRYLYWPHADVHLGWTQFEQIVDPAKVLLATEKTLKYNKRYGAAIRAMRESAGLKQSDIDGITERQLRRVEHGQQTATKVTLEALATAHSLSLAQYVDRLAKHASAIE